MKILLTGATGYVGGRLLPLLLDRSSDVRCLTRRPDGLKIDPGQTEIAIGNLLEPQSLKAALKDVHTAFYLVHSMGSTDDFETMDRRAAENFAAECTRQNVKRIIYLGGLGNPDHKLSKHLRSRQEIGDILRTSTASVIEFRASIIIGSGSLSFEMIRALVERLPVMICPKWVRVLAQPIAKLVDSLKNPTLISSNVADRHFEVRPRSAEKSIARALVNEDREFAETRWTDALSSGGQPKFWGGVRFGSRLVDSRTRQLSTTTDAAFLPIRRIGGETGWYYGTWLWQIRGFMDLLVGGVGVRRGRRDPEHLRVGDTLDFWRVEKIVEGKLLRLAAEMKVPGRAWLEFEVTEENGKSIVRQTALFDPVGLFGIAYWYALYPLHQFVFEGMLRNICKAAESLPSPSKKKSPVVN